MYTSLLLSSHSVVLFDEAMLVPITEPLTDRIQPEVVVAVIVGAFTVHLNELVPPV